LEIYWLLEKTKFERMTYLEIEDNVSPTQLLIRTTETECSGVTMVGNIVYDDTPLQEEEVIIQLNPIQFIS